MSDGLANGSSSETTTGKWNYNAKNELQDYDNGNVSFPYGFTGNITQKIIGTDETQKLLKFGIKKMFLNKDKNT